MTVTDMCAAMPVVELVEWQALDALRNAETEKARRLERKGMRAR